MNIKVPLIRFVFFCFFITVETQGIGNNETLLLVHVIFRHGDRTPDITSLYPSNPYYDESNYAPYGYGQLTNKGKLRSYNVGTALRERYRGFLDETYNINLIEPRSTYYNRTKESLQAMLAGLFPPTQDLVWLEGLNWQPIAINYLEKKYDKELFFIDCPNWNKTIHEYLLADNGRSITEKYKELFKYISHHTGENVTSLLKVAYLYFGFLIQEELNFTLPEWTKQVYPYPMRNISMLFYDASIFSENLQKTSNYLLKKIIADTKFKIEGKLPKKKMFIYSGHEFDLIPVLEIMELKLENIPPYVSYILIELHRINGIYGFKIFYQDYSSDQPLLLKLPRCEKFCPFREFVALTRKFIPEDDSFCDTGSTGDRVISSFCQLLAIFLFFNVLHFI